jgi:hypothetical protein
VSPGGGGAGGGGGGLGSVVGVGGDFFGVGGGAPIDADAAVGGLPFSLLGVRGAGGARRRGDGFVVGFTPALGAPGAAAGGFALSAAGGGGGGAGDARAPPAALVAAAGSAAAVASLYGSSAAEGLPVWLLTGGADGLVRCWDLDRPRASRTVCGLAPYEPRDAYEGVTLVPTHAVAAAAGGGERDDDDDDDDDDIDDDDARRNDDARGDGGSDDDEGDFKTRADADGLGAAAPYAHQRGKPIRAIVAMPLAAPFDESDHPPSAASLPANPFREGRGPVPAHAGHSSFITALAWLDVPARLLLTGSRDGAVKIWR